MTTDIPIGGTTGHSHAHSESVVLAAMWFSELREPPAAAVPVLRERFGCWFPRRTEPVRRIISIEN